MNPILMKPIADTLAQVIVHGRPVGNLYLREIGRVKEIMALAKGGIPVRDLTGVRKRTETRGEIK